MAVIYICDRCQKPMDSRPDVELKAQYFTNATKTTHLCSDCDIDFKEWVQRNP